MAGFRLTLKRLYSKYSLPISGTTYSSLIGEIIADNVVRAQKAVYAISGRRWKKSIKEATDSGAIVLPDYAIGIPTVRKSAENGQQITDTLRDRLSKGLRDAISDGRPGDVEGAIVRMTQNVMTVMAPYTNRIKPGEPSPYAKMIAVTEVRSAVDVAKWEYVQQFSRQNGVQVIVNKRWRHNDHLVDKPRPGHRALHGMTVPLNTPFHLQGLKADYYPMYPHDGSLPAGETIGCQCSVDYITSVQDSDIQKAITDHIEIWKAGFTTGTVRRRKDGLWRKEPNGEWSKITEEQHNKKSVMTSLSEKKGVKREDIVSGSPVGRKIQEAVLDFSSDHERYEQLRGSIDKLGTSTSIKDIPEKDLETIKYLSMFVAVAPKYRGTVYKGVPESAEEAEVGDEITLPYLSSFTNEEETAKMYSVDDMGGGAIYVIPKSTRGVDISSLTEVTEGEVLVPRGNYRVDRIEGGRIYLSEVNERKDVLKSLENEMSRLVEKGFKDNPDYRLDEQSHRYVRVDGGEEDLKYSYGEHGSDAARALAWEMGTEVGKEPSEYYKEQAKRAHELVKERIKDFPREEYPILYRYEENRWGDFKEGDVLELGDVAAFNFVDNEYAKKLRMVKPNLRMELHRSDMVDDRIVNVTNKESGGYEKKAADVVIKMIKVDSIGSKDGMKSIVISPVSIGVDIEVEDE